MEQILSVLGSLGFNWHVALANFINFIIILFLLNRYFFGKIGKVISNRQEIIKHGLNQAAEAEKALAGAEEKKQELLRAAEIERHDILVDAQAKAEQIGRDLKAETDKEIGKRLQTLETKEASYKEKIEASFAKRTPELVAKLYALTLKKEMTEEENNALLGRMSV